MALLPSWVAPVFGGQSLQVLQVCFSLLYTFSPWLCLYLLLLQLAGPSDFSGAQWVNCSQAAENKGRKSKTDGFKFNMLQFPFRWGLTGAWRPNTKIWLRAMSTLFQARAKLSWSAADALVPAPGQRQRSACFIAKFRCKSGPFQEEK